MLIQALEPKPKLEREKFFLKPEPESEPELKVPISGIKLHFFERLFKLLKRRVLARVFFLMRSETA